MSQLLDSDTDVDDGGFVPTPVGQVICGAGIISNSKLYSSAPAGSIGSVEFRMLCPAQVPVDNTLITISCDFTGSLTPIPPDTFTGTQCDITVTHDSLGLIAQLTGFGFDAGGGGSAVSTPILLNDLLAALGTTADILFGDLPGFNGPLVVTVSVGVGVDSDGNPSPNGNDLLAFQLTQFRFSIPEGTGGIIEFTGDGGVELAGEADVDIDMLSITGSGGVEVAGEPQTVLSADSSGIYTLVPDQHFDKIYTRNVNDNDTADVKIPDPFGKTGYFSG